MQNATSSSDFLKQWRVHRKQSACTPAAASSLVCLVTAAGRHVHRGRLVQQSETCLVFWWMWVVLFSVLGYSPLVPPPTGPARSPCHRAPLRGSLWGSLKSVPSLQRSHTHARTALGSIQTVYWGTFRAPGRVAGFQIRIPTPASGASGL